MIKQYEIKMKKNYKWLSTCVLFLSACVGTESGKAAHAIISLRALKQAGSQVSLVASFPLAVDNPNLNVLDSTVQVSISGNIILDDKDTVVSRFTFPAEYRKTGTIFVFDFPNRLKLGVKEAVFVGSAKDESGFLSSDTVSFINKCPERIRNPDFEDSSCP